MFAVACFPPGRAKDLSAPPRIFLIVVDKDKTFERVTFYFIFYLLLVPYFIPPFCFSFFRCSRPVLFSPAPFCGCNSLAMCSKSEDGEDVKVENDVGHAER